MQQMLSPHFKPFRTIPYFNILCAKCETHVEDKSANVNWGGIWGMLFLLISRFADDLPFIRSSLLCMLGPTAGNKNREPQKRSKNSESASLSYLLLISFSLHWCPSYGPDPTGDERRPPGSSESVGGGGRLCGMATRAGRPGNRGNEPPPSPSPHLSTL